MNSSRRLSGGLVARNMVWNLLGTVLPLPVAVVAMPLLVTGLGDDRFGMLTIVWALIGYFSILDLGLGRALTMLVADCSGCGRDEDLPGLVWTGLSLMGAIGVAAAVLVALATPLLVYRVLTIPPTLARECELTLYLLAVSLPIVIVTSGLQGILSARQRFGVISAIRTPLSAMTYLGPVLVLPFSQSLVAVSSVLVGIRVAGGVLLALACFRDIPGIRGKWLFSRASVRPLVSFGGWVTVSNVVSPLMTNIDRLIIGSMIAVSAVTYYAVPFDLVTKLLVIPAALSGVLFPAFAEVSSGSGERRHLYFSAGVKAVFIAMFPAALAVFAWGHEGLSLWMGESFANRSGPVILIVAAGMLVNGLAFIPLALLQGAGRPDIPGMLNVVEVPFYAAAMWVLTERFGIAGMAAAWSLRVGVDSALLFWFAYRNQGMPIVTRRSVVAAIMALLLLVGVSMAPLGGFGRFLLWGVLTLAITGAAWAWLLNEGERKSVLGLARSRSGASC